MRHSIWILAAAAVSLLPGAYGQQLAIDFDTLATKINWTLVGNVHTVHGTFQLKQGHLDVDRSSGNIGGEFVVATASGESGDSSRDRKMRKDVLETEKFPEVRLKVTRMEGVLVPEGTSNVRVLGQMTIHGTSHDVTIPVQVTVSGADVSGKGTFAVPYVDWGMKNPSNFLFKVNKVVDVEVMAVAHVKR